MSFTVTYPTRHTDTYAGTQFVHAGVLLGFTESAYAAVEAHCGVTKPETVVAVQRETRAIYYAPITWREGASVEVMTTTGDARGFTQEFSVRSAQTGRASALFVHQWVWLDTTTGRTIPIPEDVLAKFLAS